MRKRIVLLILLLSLSAQTVCAQKFSIGTNLVRWPLFLTYNGEIAFGVSRHISLNAGARFSNYQDKKQIDRHIIKQNQQLTVFAGMRYWPWYVNSGLWFGGKVIYQEFQRSGVWRHAMDTGRGSGVGLSLGYTLMLSPHLNLEFGAGVWGGYLSKYILYDCPVCLGIRDKGARWYGNLDDLSISLILVL